MMRKIVSWVLCLCMLVSVMPTWSFALAEEEAAVAEAAVQEEQEPAPAPEKKPEPTPEATTGPVELPQTGDSAHPLLWLSVCLMTGLGIVRIWHRDKRC